MCRSESSTDSVSAADVNDLFHKFTTESGDEQSEENGGAITMSETANVDRMQIDVDEKQVEGADRNDDGEEERAGAAGVSASVSAPDMTTVSVGPALTTAPAVIAAPVPAPGPPPTLPTSAQPNWIPWPMVEESLPEHLAFDYYAISFEREMRYLGNGWGTRQLRNVCADINGQPISEKVRTFFAQRFCTMTKAMTNGTYRNITAWRKAVNDGSWQGLNPFRQLDDMKPTGWSRDILNTPLIVLGPLLSNIPAQFRLFTAQAVEFAVQNQDACLMRADVPRIAYEQGFTLPAVLPGSNRDLDAYEYYEAKDVI